MPSDTGAQYPGKELEAMSFALNYHRWILHEFEPYLGDTVAEVGAGVGSVSRLLLGTRIKRLVAFEPSANLFPLLEKELQDEARGHPVNDVFDRKYVAEGFDTVVYINVLEHIRDDRSELANAFETLKPGGYVLLFVPALAWLYSDFDRKIGHVRRYSKASLSTVVGDVGFAVLRARYFDLAGIVPWYVKYVLLRTSMGSASVTLYDRIVVPVIRRIEGSVTPPIGKNVLLIARKPEKKDRT